MWVDYKPVDDYKPLDVETASNSSVSSLSSLNTGVLSEMMRHGLVFLALKLFCHLSSFDVFVGGNPSTTPQASVVQRLNNAIEWINHYPLDR